jgi:phasin
VSRKIISLEKGDTAVTDSEVKVGLNGNGFKMPLFGFPGIELPGAFGELAEQGIARAKEGCEKIKAASEETTEALREIYSSNASSATDYGLKVFEISNANTASAIDFFVHLLDSKSATDVVSLSVEQARNAFDTATDQNRELWALAQKLATEAGEPVKKHFAKVLQQAN